MTKRIVDGNRSKYIGYFISFFGVVLLFVISIAMQRDKTGWGMFRSFSPARFLRYQRIEYRQKKAGRKTVND